MRWAIASAVAILLACAVYYIHSEKEREVAARHEAEYQRAVASYAEGLKVGTKRIDVRRYLKARNVDSTWIFSGSLQSNAYTDIILLGRSPYPFWFCADEAVYVALVFDSSKPNESPNEFPDDRLKNVRSWRLPEHCL